MNAVFIKVPARGTTVARTTVGRALNTGASPSRGRYLGMLSNKPIATGDAEIWANPRATSASGRVGEQPGSDLVLGFPVQRSVNAVVFLQPRHDAAPVGLSS